MFAQLLQSEAVDIGQQLAAVEGNPWRKVSSLNEQEIQREISHRLKQNHLPTFEASDRKRWAALRKISLIQYLLWSAGWTTYILVVGSNLSNLWWLYFFYAPLLTVLMNYFLFRLSAARQNDNRLKQALENASAIGLTWYLKTLDSRKYAVSNHPDSKKPTANLAILTPEQAEEFSAAWLRSLGFRDATVTRFSRDGGVDVSSQVLVAQVKHQLAPVGVKAIRELFGVATHAKKIPVFFALSGYTNDAIDFAANVGMPLVQYSSSALLPINDHAELLISEGPRFMSDG
jgi:hypothetical protein